MLRNRHLCAVTNQLMVCLSISFVIFQWWTNWKKKWFNITTLRIILIFASCKFWPYELLTLHDVIFIPKFFAPCRIINYFIAKFSITGTKSKFPFPNQDTHNIDFSGHFQLRNAQIDVNFYIFITGNKHRHFLWYK